MKSLPSLKVKPVSKGALQCTDKEMVFVGEYWSEIDLGDSSFLNGKKAALRAGYRGKNAATQLLAKPRVVAALGKELRRRLNRLELKADDLLRHFATALYLPAGDLFEYDEEGFLVTADIKKLPIEIQRCITEVDLERFYGKDGKVSRTKTKVKTIDKGMLMRLGFQYLKLVDGKDINVNIDKVQVNLADLLHQVENTDNVIDVDSKGA